VNHQIPLKFRAIAAGLQAIATIPAASVVISPIAYTTIINSDIYPGFTYLATGFSLAPPIITWILWLFTKSIHPFVDESGRNAIIAVAKVVKTRLDLSPRRRTLHSERRFQSLSRSPWRLL